MKVDAIAEGIELLAAVIDLEGGDTDVAGLVDDPLLDLGGFQLHALGRVAVAADADIGGESERQVFRHLVRALGSPDLERHVALAQGMPIQPVSQRSVKPTTWSEW